MQIFRKSKIKHKENYAAQDSFKIVGMDYSNPKNVRVKIQILGSGSVFMRPIKDVYEDKELLAKFSKLQAIFIGTIFYASLYGNINEYKNIPLSELYSFKLLPFISILFVTIMLLANITGCKLARIFGIDFTVSTLFFPMVYLITALITEVYGYKYTRRIIWGVTFCNLLFMLGTSISVFIPNSPFWHLQTPYGEIMNSVPRLIVGSTVAYTCSEFFNSYALAKIKIMTKGRYFIFRSICSASIGILVDSLLFCFIAFSFTVPGEIVWAITVVQFFMKMLFIIIGSFLMKYVVDWVKNKEKIDHYDYGTNFNPFLLRLND